MNAKRAHGDGSVEQYGEGRWRARWRVNGERQTKGGFRTEKLALSFLRKTLSEIDAGVWFDDRLGKVPFSVYAEKYMEFRESSVEPSTFRNDRSYLKRWLLPTFGKMPIGSITVQTVDTWWAKMPPTVSRRNAYFFLTKAMTYAVRWQYIKHNPCQVEDAGKNVAKPRPKYTKEDVALIASYADELTRTVMMVALSGHLRIGEVCGLERQDYNPMTGKLTIERQLSVVGPKRTTGTKTDTVRTVKMLAPGIEALNTWLESRPMLPGAPIFTGPKGGRIDRARIRAGWDAAKIAAGFPDTHFHDLKRVGLTLVARTGADMKDVMHRGGHRSYTAALSYMDASEDRDEELAEAVNAKLTIFTNPSTTKEANA